MKILNNKIKEISNKHAKKSSTSAQINKKPTLYFLFNKKNNIYIIYN